MLHLSKMLNEWVHNTLITSKQAEAILSYENSKSNGSWILYGFLSLGVIIMGIGVISLVAVNWQNISDTTKLITNLLLLISFSASIYFAWEKKKQLLSEILLIFFLILCLASIGLISQIYHSGGALYQALLIWSVITAGAAAISKRFFPSLLWAIGFFLSITFTALDSPSFQQFFQKHQALVFMTIPLLSAALMMMCQRIRDGEGAAKAFKTLTLVGGLIALLALETKFPKRTFDHSTAVALIPGYVFTLILSFGILKNLAYKKIQKVSLLTALYFYLLLFHLSLFQVSFSILYAACSITILGSMAIAFASLKFRGLFQAFLVLLGARFLILYFQALGGLALTGVGLIISGVIIVLMVIIWNKYHKKIISWAEAE